MTEQFWARVDKSGEWDRRRIAAYEADPPSCADCGGSYDADVHDPGPGHHPYRAPAPAHGPAPRDERPADTPEPGDLRLYIDMLDEAP